jgi:uncharacterized membrane protein YfcA
MDALTIVRGGTLLLASAAAGAINSVAGGGTLLTFPTLISLGLSSVHANATSTVGLVLGSVSGAWGYRREVAEVRRWLLWLVPSSFLGGVVGALVLTRTPESLFAKLVPLLVLGATVLFSLNEPIARFVRRSLASDHSHAGEVRYRMLVAGAQFFIALYGGYFGAGIGILMLAALGLLQLGSIHQMNGIKTILGAVINGMASALFIAKGLVHWPEALMMVVGSVLGGYFGADTARKLGPQVVRRIVIGIGLVAAVTLAIRQLR